MATKKKAVKKSTKKIVKGSKADYAARAAKAAATRAAKRAQKAGDEATSITLDENGFVNGVEADARTATDQNAQAVEARSIEDRINDAVDEALVEIGTSRNKAPEASLNYLVDYINTQDRLRKLHELVRDTELSADRQHRRICGILETGNYVVGDRLVGVDAEHRGISISKLGPRAESFDNSLRSGD